jgi:tripartite-type tricarboxylate transporter receptor subunit TctC
MKVVAWVAAATAMALGVAPPAMAQFYKTKTVTMLVNYPPGGPTDIEARIVARHLPKHVPGKPTIIVKNQGGGGGMIGTNYLGEVAKPDGLTLGFFTWNVLAAALGDPGLRVKYTDFAFIAGVENPIVFYIRKDTKPGIKAAADIMKASGFKALSLDAQNTNTIQQTLALDLLGLKYKAVPGYKGLKGVETAILQGEGNMANTSLPGWRASIQPTMEKRGIVIPLWHLTARSADGTAKRSQSVPELPTFEEFYAQVKGGAPTGIKYDALRMIIDPFTSMFRTIFMPPKTPAGAVATMRDAVAALWKDEAFLKDYEKAVKNRPNLVVGAEGEKIIAQVVGVKPELAAFLRKYMADVAAGKN